MTLAVGYTDVAHSGHVCDERWRNITRYVNSRGGLGLELREAMRQGLTLVHFSPQPKPFWSHLPVSPCLIDWRRILHPTYPTKCAYVEPKSGRV